VKPHSPFNVEEDCKILRKAMKGIGMLDCVENVMSLLACLID